jgi:hypothetical protein
MSYAEYKHYFKITESNDILIDDIKMFLYDCKRQKGNKKYLLIRSDGKKVDHPKFKFYFGVIIGKYCLNSNSFSGYSKEVVHQILFSEIKGKKITFDGRNITVFDKPFDKFNDDDMTEYLNELIPHLVTTHNIYINTKSDDYEYKG